MRAYDLILDKREGREHSEQEIRWLVEGITSGDVADYQASAWLMAAFLRGLSRAELLALTSAMLRSGDLFDLSHLPGPKVDKHSTGGVGDKISLPLAPLAAACGLRVPMISGRGLGHTGGTLDKLESIPGFSTRVAPEKFVRLVEQLGLCLAGQTERLAPADRKLYALRDATATVDSIPLIASSILSKKLAEGVDGLVFDVKCGTGAFMKDISSARALAQQLVELARAAGKGAVAWVTSMDEPLGRAVGNALEVAESVAVLRGEGPSDVTALTLALGAEMLVLGGLVQDVAEGRRRMQRAIEDRSGLQRLRALVEAQGGDPRCIDDPGLLPRARMARTLTAPRGGFVVQADALSLGLAAVALGAGRERKEDAVSPGAGLLLLVKRGERVEAGAPLCTLFADHPGRLDAGAARAGRAFQISDALVPLPDLLIEKVG